MPIRPDLLRWQFAGYPANHQDRVNLVIHVLTVPLFWLGAAMLLRALITFSLLSLGIGFGLMLFAFLAQGIGHRREQNPPVPFDGAADFFSRIVVEQFVSFPRYALQGLRARD
ncbi:hypothetical protein [Viridibacterium curvum]|uniref:DUF962 domain-containing protein n=1 Tax=Viridibacterium curvum TaxID=1101404 RepID=A0ABP9QS36_9RHOO